MESFDNGNEEITDFNKVCSILSDLWLNYKDDKDFKEFIEYNDIGLPLAFLIDSEIVVETDQAVKYVIETWEIFLSALGIEKDLGWGSLDELFNYVEEKNKK